MINNPLKTNTELMGIEQYREIKESSADLVNLSGSAFTESGYNLDFTYSKIVAAEEGIYPQHRQTVRVAYHAVHRARYESLLLVFQESGIRDGASEKMLGRKVGITVIRDEVAYAWQNSILPQLTKFTPEAQPVSELDTPTSEDFESWQHQIIGRHPVGPTEADMLLTNIHQIANLD